MMPEKLKNYKGYDWEEFSKTYNSKEGEALIQAFKDYVKRSVVNSTPEEIIDDMKNSVKNSYINDRTVLEIVKFIIDHAEYHKYLVLVNDGSYRMNRILYKNHEYPGYENFRIEGIKQLPVRLKDLLDQVIDRNGCIFIQPSKKSDFDMTYYYDDYDDYDDYLYDDDE